MKKFTILNYQVLVLLVAGGFFVLAPPVEADSLGQQTNFNVDMSYDLFGRSQVSATLRKVGQFAYFYVEDEYWNSLNSVDKNALIVALGNLADEFDGVIYPKERAVFGSEWSPGIDNDVRITILLTQLVNNAGGYINTYDEFPKSQIFTSNEREMIYLNAGNIFDSKNKSFLAHEFQHLISFYQKTKLHNLEEEVWLNEARSEYAPTLLGYNEIYPGSYLADRVDSFLDNPSDSLTEWQNKPADYGVVNLFMHYLIGHYGQEILTRMVLNDKIGIASINQALSDLGYSERFDDIFADWAIASYLNDCQVGPKNKYCYLDDNLNYYRLHVDYSASYSGFPNLIVSRSSAIKDWSAQWYRFRQGTAMPTTRDTLKLEFFGSTSRGDFKVPYIVVDSNGQTTIQFMPLDNQAGSIYISNFTSQNKSLIIIPFNQYKTSGFTSLEPSSSFSFTASSVASNLPIINSLSPQSGLTKGGFPITLRGANLSTVKKIIFGQTEIIDFEIINDQTITFIAPAHPVGLVDVQVENSAGETSILNSAFTYTNPSSYPDGSLLRARGDYKVYVIKGGYKRWIQTAEIFNAYQHLRWEEIIEVSPDELAQYQEVWLIRADGDYKVYQVDAAGQKHWLNMTAEQFIQSGRLWEMIYIVNSFERDFYQLGGDIFFE